MFKEKIFNRVIMMANQSFFGLTPKEQEMYLIDFFKDKKNDEIFSKIIGKEFFNNPNLAYDFDNLSILEYNIYNDKKIRFSGFGENKVLINEFFMSYNNLINLDTLYKYDYEDHKDQIRLEIENIKASGFGNESEFKNKKYKFRIKTLWVMMLINDEFNYTTFISATEHIKNVLSEYSYKEIRNYYPTKTLQIKKNENDMLSQLGLKIDAYGKEDNLKELRKRIIKKVESLSDEIDSSIKENEKDGVVIIENDYENEKNKKIIVTSEDIAKKLYWRTIYKNIKENEIDILTFNNIIEEYKLIIKDFIADNFNDIENNYSPNIFKRKEKNILFSSKALNEIESIIKNKNDED